MSKLKKLFASLLVVFALVCSAAPACTVAKAEGIGQSAPQSIITPMWTYINSVMCWMDIDSTGNASMVASMESYSTVTSIKITSNLQRYQNGWTTVKSWTQTFSGTYGTWMKSYYVYSGYNYRLQSNFYAYVGSTQVREHVADFFDRILLIPESPLIGSPKKVAGIAVK